MTPLSVICESRAHCDTCRDPAATAWRADLARNYNWPGFPECPLGKPWGFVDPNPPNGWGDKAGRKMSEVTGSAPCNPCVQIEATLNAVEKVVKKLKPKAGVK